MLAKLNFFNTAVFGVLDVLLDRYPPVPVPLPGVVGKIDGEALLSRIVYAQAWLGFIATIPWIEGSSGGLGFDHPEDIERTLWLFQTVGLAMDSFWQPGGS